MLLKFVQNLQKSAKSKLKQRVGAENILANQLKNWELKFQETKNIGNLIQAERMFWNWKTESVVDIGKKLRGGGLPLERPFCKNNWRSRLAVFSPIPKTEGPSDFLLLHFLLNSWPFSVIGCVVRVFDGCFRVHRRADNVAMKCFSLALPLTVLWVILRTEFKIDKNEP